MSAINKEQQAQVDKLQNLRKYTLSKPVKVADKEYTEIDLDFDRVTGRDVLKLKGKSAAIDEQYPDEFLLEIIAKASGLKTQEIESFPIVDYLSLLTMVNAFLLIAVSKAVT